MPLDNTGIEYGTTPLRLEAKTCTDSLAVEETGAGGMIALQNLITDPSTKNLWIARPAGFQITNFPGLSSPGFISGLVMVGDYACGMIATSRNAGKDEPFVYNVKTNTVITVTGITSGNSPTSPPTSGAWTPPILALINAKVLIAHPGYSGTGTNFFGVLDMTNPTAPTYATQNTTTNALPCPPTSIEVFSNRAWFACNPILYGTNAIPGLFFSDAGNPTTITNSGTAQVLTLNDSELITALGTLQYENQLGGIVQALIAFKGIGNIYQVTGDAALTGNNALALNTLNVATGTLAPLSITNTPKGLIFLAPDGYRLIDANGVVSDPIGTDGQGVTMPFIYSGQISRVNIASNAKVVRGTTINANFNQGVSQAAPSPNVAQEWWFDVTRNSWSGPHTQGYDQIVPYNDTFIGAPTGIPGVLWQTDIKQRPNSTFVENGVALNYCIQWCFTPEMGDLNQQEVVESYVLASFVNGGGTTMQAGVLDEYGNVLNFITVPGNTNAQSLWGTGVWGIAKWSTLGNVLTPLSLPWNRPINFARGSFFFSGASGFGLEFGALYLRLNKLGFIKSQLANNPNMGPS